MAGDLLANSLPVGIRESSDPNLYEIGVTWDGVFVVFATRSRGGIDADRAEAAKNAPPAPPTPPSA